MRPTDVWILVLLLVAAGCTTTPETDMQARLAGLEGRVAQLEAARAGGIAATGDAEPDDPDPADDPADAAGGAPDLAPSEKEAFADAAGEESLKARAGLDADADVRFDEATDTLLVRAEALDADAAEAAWEAAQGLADLWGTLEAYQPVLDLQVGEVRCACSATLMKGVDAGTADRQVWEQACR